MSIRSTDRPRTVCLISSLDSHIFPFNSRSFFSNSFVSPLANPDQTEFYVTVRCVGLSVDTRVQVDGGPGCCKVQLYEVEEQASGTTYDRCLTSFPYPAVTEATRIGNDNYNFHTFDRAPFLPLRLEVLDKLTILFTDENDQKLTITSGSPSVVLLELLSGDEMTERHSFNITCRSLQYQLYEQNTLSKFTAPLQEMLHLKDYEVALLNVVFPSDMYEACVGSFRVEDEVYNYDLANMVSVQQLLDAVNADLRRGVYGNEIRFYQVGVGGIVQPPGRVQIYRRQNLPPTLAGQQDVIRVQFSWGFARAMGDLAGLAPDALMMRGHSFFFPVPADLELAKPNPVALLTCDVVKPSILGGELDQLLNVVPVRLQQWAGNRQAARTMMYEPASIHYQDVKETPFDSLSFQFLTPGNRVGKRMFMTRDPQNNCVIVTLGFRPKKRR